MSFTGNTLQNASSKLYTDVYGNFFEPGTKIVTYTLNEAPVGTMNQQWRIIPMMTGRNLFVIQSVSTGLYAVVDGTPDINKGIVTGLAPMEWEINTFSGPVSYNIVINVPNTDLFWDVTSSELFTQIILSKKADVPSQMWTPRPTLPSP
ncbi:hypothetical protein BDZ94DRAFT_814192 [Collybia nuda]|uniref:Ricin B lectin domain-containing protein n=1 Tax=Collybia nuda TaxID=64659 RepID=A0A9P5Y5C2_9AGAR|nr:hypothetical protein BDZ94DRAFT_814192 [Collybia nuda]